MNKSIIHEVLATLDLRQQSYRSTRKVPNMSTIRRTSPRNRPAAAARTRQAQLDAGLAINNALRCAGDMLRTRKTWHGTQEERVKHTAVTAYVCVCAAAIAAMRAPCASCSLARASAPCRTSHMYCASIFAPPCLASCGNHATHKHMHRKQAQPHKHKHTHSDTCKHAA